MPALGSVRFGKSGGRMRRMERMRWIRSVRSTPPLSGTSESEER